MEGPSLSNRLLDILSALPPLYAPGTAPFWDDDHISKGMLAAHLDPTTDAASRKPDFLAKSADWIARCTGGGAGKALLDLGCGPGLYDELFCARGFAVTGVDLSRRSIAWARESAGKKGLPIRYIRQNYLELAPSPATYDVVVLIYCDYGVLSPENRALVLKTVYESLKPGGLLFLDGHTPLMAFHEGDEVSWQKGGFWAPEEYMCIDRHRLYARTANVLDQHIVLTRDKLACYNIWNQLFTGEGLENELAAAGLSVAGLYDDIAGAPYTGQGDTVAIVGKKPL